MARPREFEEQAALEGAMQIFWRQGFMATNLPDLLRAMGLTRGSFYKAFHDKERVYLLALDRYDQKVVTTTVQALQGCDQTLALDCLMMLFSEPENPQRGCFICNAMVELAPVNPEVALRANAMAARIGAAILSVVQRCYPALPRGEAQQTADVILHLYFGYQAMVKSQSEHANWRARLAQVLP
ncbi:MAG: TetR/AcrR family transcriptional regulator [Pelagimonas sp.]|jgi:TetR/AcrR family transcriptional repressor of nem operon|nr:TetR/AcrR family transcriptional regulator [Pelagimonas sp.]